MPAQSVSQFGNKNDETLLMILGLSGSYPPDDVNWILYTGTSPPKEVGPSSIQLLCTTSCCCAIVQCPRILASYSREAVQLSRYSTSEKSAISDYRQPNLYPSNNPIEPLWSEATFQPYAHVVLKFFQTCFDLHRSLREHNAIPHCLPGRRRGAKLSGVGNLAFEFDIASLRLAGRPTEYTRTTDRSEEAIQGPRERQLFFFRKQVEQRGCVDHRDMSAQLIQRGQICEIRRVG